MNTSLQSLYKNRSGKPGRLNIFVLVWVFFMSAVWSFSAAGMTVQGTVLSAAGEPEAGVEVVLLKIVMQKKPAIKPLQQSRTDRNGRFLFTLEPFEGNVFFRVSAGSESSLTGSEPFRLSANQPVKTLKLRLTKAISGIENFIFNKQIIIFEALEEALQITEVIYFSNGTDSVVETGNTPFLKRIPRDAENFQYFRRQAQFKAKRNADQVRFDLVAAPGDHQLVFSYDFPVGSRSAEFSAYLPEGMKELEVVAPSNSLQLSFVESDRLMSNRILTQDKQFNRKNYRSQTIFPEGSPTEIKVQIRNIPFSQSRFYYAAIFLAVLLAGGFLFFLARRSPAKPKPGIQ